MKNPSTLHFAVHTHGIDDIDYSDMEPSDLERIAVKAAERGLQVCPTVFLRQEYFSQFEAILDRFSMLKCSSEEDPFSSILGFGMEGPLLGTHGGVPDEGCWVPSVSQWRRIARLGEKGLRYLVIGCDEVELDEEVAEGMTFRGLVDLFYAHGVRLALGHFQHDDPLRSSRLIQELVDHVWQMDGCDQGWVLTDHLFNDMPRNFVHAWRTDAERLRRSNEIRPILDAVWSEETLAELLGPGPAALIRFAKQGKSTLPMDFDGGHPDSTVAKLTLDYVGHGGIIGMTDDIQTVTMAGQPVYGRDDNRLQYRSDGRVAACRSTVADCISTMSMHGFDAAQIQDVFSTTPSRVFGAIHALTARGLVQPTASTARV